MNKPIMAQPCSEILFAHKKEWSIDTNYSLDQSWKQYAKLKKPDKMAHDNSICMKCPEKANL